MQPREYQGWAERKDCKGQYGSTSTIRRFNGSTAERFNVLIVSSRTTLWLRDGNVCGCRIDGRDTHLHHAGRAGIAPVKIQRVFVRVRRGAQVLGHVSESPSPAFVAVTLTTQRLVSADSMQTAGSIVVVPS